MSRRITTIVGCPNDSARTRHRTNEHPIGVRSCSFGLTPRRTGLKMFANAPRDRPLCARRPATPGWPARPPMGLEGVPPRRPAGRSGSPRRQSLEAPQVVPVAPRSASSGYAPRPRQDGQSPAQAQIGQFGMRELGLCDRASSITSRSSRGRPPGLPL